MASAHEVNAEHVDVVLHAANDWMEKVANHAVRAEHWTRGEVGRTYAILYVISHRTPRGKLERCDCWAARDATAENR